MVVDVALTMTIELNLMNKIQVMVRAGWSETLVGRFHQLSLVHFWFE